MSIKKELFSSSHGTSADARPASLVPGGRYQRAPYRSATGFTTAQDRANILTRGGRIYEASGRPGGGLCSDQPCSAVSKYAGNIMKTQTAGCGVYDLVEGCERIRDRGFSKEALANEPSLSQRACRYVHGTVHSRCALASFAVKFVRPLEE